MYFNKQDLSFLILVLFHGEALKVGFQTLLGVVIVPVIDGLAWPQRSGSSFRTCS